MPLGFKTGCKGLGIESYVGSSGRIFPLRMKAAPLLRAWLKRLADAGVQFHYRHQVCDLKHNQLSIQNLSTAQIEQSSLPPL